MPVPYTFANQTGNIPLAQLDANFSNVKASADTAVTVSGSSQPAITSVGQLTSLTVNGNVRTLLGGVYSPGYYWANGVSILTGLSTGSSTYGNSNVAAYLPTYNGGFDNLAGNVTTTGVVNASTGIFSGRIQGGNVFGTILTTSGYVSATGAVTGGSLVSNTTITGNSVTAYGNIAGGNFTTSGNVVASQRVQAAAFLTAGTIQGSDIYSTGLLRGANLVISGSSEFSGISSVLNSTAATSTSTAAFVVTGGIAIGKNAYFGGDGANAIIHTGNVLPSSSFSYNLGSSTRYYNTFYGTSTQAKYADLAENYQADRDYEAGTVLMFGGLAEVTVADPATKAVAGVVSENPAHLMNSTLTGPGVVALALQGRVPCNVIGPVKKGDLLVSAGDGYARSNNDAQPGQVIGKSLKDFSGEKGRIEVVVGRT